MQIRVNEVDREVDDAPARSLLVVLREELGLTAAKYGCGEGACGACTVLVDGLAVRSCVLAADEVGSRPVTTLEGLTTDVVRGRLGTAFAAHGAYQCGYCTPGMLVRATALLHDDAEPTEERIVAAMDGNLCRCGCYRRITGAIGEVARGGAAVSAPAGAAPAAGAAATAPSGPNAEPASLPSGPPRPWGLTPAPERDWFAILGDGLVVVLEPDEVERALHSTGRGWSTPGGAWIHVGSDGRVRAFTGKVDLGQHNTAALARLVAAELGLTDPGSVEVVAGDTDLCPEDMGTFGSRSMADAGTLLSATARSTREAIIRLAATAWEASVPDLVLRNGTVVSRDGARQQSVGELVKGHRAVESARWDGGRDLAPLPPPHASSAVPLARYTSDLALPGMLHGRVLRPPAFGALLRSVDTRAAAAMHGVTVLHEDGFVGVTAPDPSTATTAIEAIRAEWDVEPDLPSEAGLESWLREHPVEAEGWDGNVDRAVGDVEAALLSATTRLAHTYQAATIAHVPLETRVAVAAHGDDGRLTVWTGTQRPFGVRAQVAEALGVPEERVRVIVPPTGSGYGGKHSGDAAVEAARLARATNNPVKVRWSRAEEFTEAYLRPAAVIDIRSGLDAEGHLVAWEMRTLNAGANAIATPYDVPNQHLAFQPTEAPLRQGSYRALAATANTFAREVHMDELAAAARVDPLEFRLSHLRDERLAAVLRAAADRAGWPNHAEGEGIGIALGFEKDGRIATCVRVHVAEDGTLSVSHIVAAYDCGRIVDRDGLANQVEGATVMGLGGALFERIAFDHGRITNPSLNTYRVPRFRDVPPIEVVLLDQPDQPSVGAGETPIIAIAPAVANAIFSATGRRPRAMPLLDEHGKLASAAAPHATAEETSD